MKRNDNARGSWFVVRGSRLARAAGDVGPYRRTTNHEPRTTILTILVLAASVSMGAVPLRWTVETSRVSPVVFDAVRGETLALEAAFQSYGNPLEMAGKDAFIFWQTNGMGRLYWNVPATVTTLRGDAAPGVANPTNVIAAAFTPAMDPGSPTVTGFLGSTGDIYRAAFTLRFRNGPGATPNALPLPTPTIDCATTTFLHPEAAPFSGGGGGAPAATVITNHVESGYLCTVAAAQAKADAALQAAKNDASARFVRLSGIEGQIQMESPGSGFTWNLNTLCLGDPDRLQFGGKDIAFVQDIDFSTNNTALVSVVTNLAPSRARGLVLRDPVRNCNWYPVVTNGVFYWLIED